MVKAVLPPLKLAQEKVTASAWAASSGGWKEANAGRGKVHRTREVQGQPPAAPVTSTTGMGRMSGEAMG